MANNQNDRGQGNYGNPEQHADAGRQSHKNLHNDHNHTNQNDQTQDSEFYSEIGSMQGKGNNPGNFANDTEKARRAGTEGGRATGDNSHTQRD